MEMWKEPLRMGDLPSVNLGHPGCHQYPSPPRNIVWYSDFFVAHEPTYLLLKFEWGTCHLCLRKTVSVRDAELEEAVSTPSADLQS